MGDYNNDGVRVNNEDDKVETTKIRAQSEPFLGGGYLVGLIVCAADNAASSCLAHDEVEPVGEPTAFLKVGALWVLLLSRSRLASVPFRS